MRLCVVDVIAPYYRANIFKRIAQEWDSCWLFGKDNSGIKQLEENDLLNLNFVKNRHLFGSKIYYQTSVVSKLFSPDIGAFLVNGEPFCLSMWGLLILRPIFARRKKIYLWTHGWYGREGFAKKLIKHLWTSLSSGVFVYGEYARTQAIIQGNPQRKLWVIHNSLDYESQIALRAQVKSTDIYKHHFGNQNHVLLFIGRVTKSKRLDLLIDATSKLINSGCKCNIVIIGDGILKQELKSKAQALDVPIWFYGSCYDEKINAELIYNADLCVSPGNVGLTAIHTMTFGTPVITHSNFPYQGPEFEAIKVNKTGDFFQEGDADSLAEVIKSWLTHHDDREAVRKDCYHEIDNFWTPDFQMNEFRKHINL